MKRLRYLLICIFCLCACAGFSQKKWSLEECIQHAWTNHPQIIQAGQTKEITAIQTEQIKANRYPNLNFNASQNANFGRSIDPFTYQFTNESIFSNNFSLNSNVTLFSGFRNKYSIEQSETQVLANEQNIERIKNDIALNIASQYLQVLLLKEQLVALDSQINKTIRQQVRTEKLIEGEKNAPSAIYQVKAQLANEKAQRTDIESRIEIALLNLKFSSAITQDNFDVQTPEINQQLPDINAEITSQTLLATASANQPSMKFARLNEEVNLKGMKISESGKYPLLSLNGSLSSGYSSARKLTSVSYSYINQPIGYLFSTPTEIVYGPVPQTILTQGDYSFGKQVKDNFSQFLGLSLRVPIFNNRQVKSNISISRINYERAHTETALTQLNLQRDIEQALAYYRAAAKKLVSYNELVTLQEQTYNDLMKLYENGRSTLFEVMNQKTMVFNAQSSVIQSRYELLFRKLVLDYYNGNAIKL